MRFDRVTGESLRIQTSGAAAFSPDGRFFVTADRNGQHPYVKNLATGTVSVINLAGHIPAGITAHVSALAVSSDGRRVLFVSGGTPDGRYRQHLFVTTG